MCASTGEPACGTSGKPKEAIEEYRKALKLDPNHINANRNTGVVLAYDLNDKKGAVKAFEKYLELAPTAPDAAADPPAGAGLEDRQIANGQNVT